jgi:hypothetical protein
MSIFMSSVYCAGLLRDLARLLWILVLIAALGMGGVAYGQAVGHYLGGATGLENGTTPPPGVFVAYFPYIYRVDTIKNEDGRTIARPDITIAAQMPVYSVVTQKKVLGADYGFTVILVLVNTRFTSALFDASAASAGVSDMYFAPVVLGWERGKKNFTVNYGFYAPTGDYDPTKVLNPGLGFWEHQIQAGMTYALDAKKLWNTSALTTWEINMSKFGSDVRPGPMFTGEYSFGRRFGQYKWNAGITGYGYKKLAADSGTPQPPLFRPATSQAFGIGPEIKYTNIKWKLAVNFRYQEQFGVQLGTSGRIFTGSITFLNIFPPKSK